MKFLSRGAKIFCLVIFFQLMIANFSLAKEKIDINSAPLEDLVKIIHIGEKRAKELISKRPFSSIDDLMRIKGLGKKAIEDIKKQDLAWVRPKEKITYPSGIFFTEILPSPIGPDAEKEWIEIFNQNDFEVDLSGWQITDSLGKVKNYIFPKGTTIGAKEFLVLSRKETKIILNNDGDELKLLQPNGKVVDSVSYERAPQGESYNRTKSGWVWSKILTPGKRNIVPQPQKREIENKKELAGIGKQIPQKNSFPFLIAFLVAIFSGIIILILKIKLSENENLLK